MALWSRTPGRASALKASPRSPGIEFGSPRLVQVRAGAEGQHEAKQKKTPAELARHLASGPYDLAWLLERTADFGPEVPPWKNGKAGGKENADKPPPPLQILIPESVAFDAQDVQGGSGDPKAVYFTDRGGFLRGLRRTARQGPQLCQAFLCLMRHREQALTLTHSSDIAFERHVLVSGAKAWTDRMYQYTGVPKEMEGALFYAGPHATVPTGELLLSSPIEGYAYIWSEDKSESDGGVPRLDWDFVPSSMTFGSGRMVRIYKKMLAAGSSLAIPIHYMWIGGVAFQPADIGEWEKELDSEVPAPARLEQTTSELGGTSPSSGGKTRKKRSSVLRGGTFSSERPTYTWRLVLADRRVHRLTDEEVAMHFGFTSDGRQTPWPAGSRLLKSHFWEGQSRGGSTMVYHYEALRTEAQATHEGTKRNAINHFERYGFLDDVADSNLASSAPILLSQRLSYNCKLELLSGDFEFVRDCRGQLWLADARDLYVIPASRGPAGSSSAPQDGSLSQKLPRYLSEEALQVLQVPDETGQKCQRMLELMQGHYQQVKNNAGMQELLRKTDEVVECTIPMLEGTDHKAFARTFGRKRPKTPDEGVNVGLAAEINRRHPVAPRQQTTLLRGRRARPAAAPPPGAAPRDAAADQRLQARPPQQPWPRQRRWTGTAGRASPAVPAALALAGVENLPSTPSKEKAESTVYMGRRNALTVEDLRRTRRPEEQNAGIEIVLAATAQKLLAFSGPGLRPDGPTLDVVGPMSARAPGTGLQERRRTAKPEVRLVEVPPGAVAAKSEPWAPSAW